MTTKEICDYFDLSGRKIIESLEKEGFEFKVEKWIHPHNGDENIYLKFKTKRLREWVAWNISYNGEKINRNDILKCEKLFYAKQLFDEYDGLKDKCIKNLIKNNFKKIEIKL